jgi:hypothetical protein
MRANQFTKRLQQLDEVAMNPNSLRQLASKINAKAGMEFEMYVPNAAQSDSDYDSENDYDADESAQDIDDIIRFFGENDASNPRDLDRLRDRLYEKYNEWEQDTQDAEWDNGVGKEELLTYYSNSDAGKAYIDQAMNDLGFTAQEKDEAKEGGEAAEGITSSKDLPKTVGYQNWVKAVTAAEPAIEEKVDELWDEKDSDEYYAAHEQWLENAESPDMREFLREYDLDTMSEVERQYSNLVNWPYQTNSSNSGDKSIEDVAREFKSIIGRNVNYSDSYHGGRRDDHSYVVEPDGSLDEPADPEDGGIEFISPPLPLDEMLSDLKKVQAWAESSGCYTNESTGLHINVSVPGITDTSIDYVKLAILLGDQYVLEQFGRSSNSFCKSALEQVKKRAQQHPEESVSILNQMRSGLNALASKAIHSGATSKYTSINTKQGYIEFRSPGGDWLDENFDKIESTLLRTVVALDAAVHPEKYRKEYLTKLYKILQVQSEGDPMSIFAKYAAGELPKDQLKGAIQQLQLQREITRKPKTGAQDATKYWFLVTAPGLSAAKIEVLAATPEQAKIEARNSWGVRDNHFTDDQMIAKPLRKYVVNEPTQPSGEIWWDVYDINSNQTLHTFTAPTRMLAFDKGVAWARMDPTLNPQNLRIREHT